MNTWYWLPIGLAVAAVGWGSWSAWRLGDAGSAPGWLLMAAVLSCTLVMCTVNGPVFSGSPAPADTRQCVTQQLESSYDPAERRPGSHWVCTGWAE